MGRQTSFFMTLDDCAEVEARFRGAVPLTVLASRSDGPRPRVVDSLTAIPNELTYLLCRPEDLEAVQTHHVPQQGYYSVDSLRSQVVEFWRCRHEKQLLYRSRIYFQPGYYDDSGTWVMKDAAFIKWAESLRAILRRYLIREDDCYVGPHALEWRRAGGTFSDF